LSNKAHIQSCSPMKGLTIPFMKSSSASRSRLVVNNRILMRQLNSGMMTSNKKQALPACARDSSICRPCWMKHYSLRLCSLKTWVWKFSNRCPAWSCFCRQRFDQKPLQQGFARLQKYFREPLQEKVFFNRVATIPHYSLGMGIRFSRAIQHRIWSVIYALWRGRSAETSTASLSL